MLPRRLEVKMMRILSVWLNSSLKEHHQQKQMQLWLYQYMKLSWWCWPWGWQLPSMLSNSQTPTQTMLGTVCGPQKTLGRPWELCGRVDRTGWATTGTVWQQGQHWGQQCPATPSIPCWVFHNRGQEAKCFMCHNTIAGYSHALHPYKTQA